VNLTCPECGTSSAVSYKVAHESGKGSGVTYIGGVAVGTAYSTALSDETAPPKPPNSPRPWLWGCGILFLAPLVAQVVLMIGVAVINALPKKRVVHVAHIVHTAHASISGLVVMLLSLVAAGGVVLLGVWLYRRAKRRRELERQIGYEPSLRAWLRSYVCRSCNRRFQV
jgi:uncharacterized membrane protein